MRQQRTRSEGVGTGQASVAVLCSPTDKDSVPFDQPTGTPIRIGALLTLTFLLLFSLISPETAVADTPDGEWDGWTIDDGVWEIGVPTAGPGGCAPRLDGEPSSECAGTVLDGYYAAEQDNRLISPVIDMPSIASSEQLLLRYWHWFSYSTYDSGQVQISVWDAADGRWGDDVAEWTEIGTPLANTSAGWSQRVLDLSAYAGERVRLGFYHVAHRSPSYSASESYGWYLDDVELVVEVPAFSGDFESGWEGWSADVGVWQVGAPTTWPDACPEHADGSPNTHCAGTALDGVYAAFTDSRLIGAPVELPSLGGDEQLLLRYWQAFSYSSHDSGQVQVSVWDSGAGVWGEWKNEGDPVVNSSGWSRRVLDLSAYAGERVRLGFYHVAHRSPSYSASESYGWYIDDIEFLVNAIPILNAINAQQVDEGGSLTIQIAATDADGGTLELSALGLPGFGSLQDNGDGTGSIRLDPTLHDSGSYPISVTVTDGLTTVTTGFTLTVNEIGNDLSDGLVAHFSFDGNFRDGSGNDNDAIAYNGVEFVDGVAGQSIWLNGIDDYLVVPYDPIVEPLVFSISTWVSTTDTDGATVITSDPDSYYCHHGYNLSVYSESPQFVIDPTSSCGDGTVVFGSAPVNDGQWHHLVASYDGNLRLYVDGVLQNDTKTSAYHRTHSALRIGMTKRSHNDPEKRRYFLGAIDDLRIYDRPLSEPEILELSQTRVHTPVFSSIETRTVVEGEVLSVVVSASDPDGDPLTLEAINSPSFAAFSDNGDGTGTFQFIPQDGDAEIYQIIVAASDGNFRALGSFYLIVNRLPDTEGPTLTDVRFDGTPLDDGAVITRAGTLSCMAADPSAIAWVEFAIDSTPIGTDRSGSDSFSQRWEVVDFADGPHSVVIIAYDSFGNQTSATRSVSVALEPPEAPVITQPTDGLVINEPQVLVAGTAEKGSEVLLYRNGEQIGALLALDYNNGFSGTLPLQEGANSIQAAAQNRAGIGPLSATVTATVDLQIPDPPTGLYATPRPAGEVRLLWNAVNDPDVVGYDLYRSTQSFSSIDQATKVNAETLVGTLFDDLPPADGLYFYRVVSVTGIGKVSDPSREASAAADATPPRALAVDYAPAGPYDPDTGRMAPGVVEVVVTLSEPVESTPFLSINSEGAEPNPVALTREADTQYRGSYEITADTPTGTAYAVFSARDRAGNQGTEIDTGQTILIDTDGPAVAAVNVDPPEPIQNSESSPVAVSVSIELGEILPADQTPELSYLLSGPGRQPGPIEPLTQTSGTVWEGSFPLPGDAGLTEPETFSFSFSAEDDLGNLGTAIYGDNLFQVYQGDLPPLDPPTGLTAEALPGGQVQLRWNSVEGASNYQVFRQSPGEPDLTAHQRTGGTLELVDETPVDGLYRYAVATVRLANAQETVSAHGEVVEVKADSVPPEAPTGLTVELLPCGVSAAWEEPQDEDELTYALYRAPAEIIAVEGLTPILTGITEPTALDTTPFETDHFYAVTAIDAAGNASLPSASAYLAFDLLPVSSLQVEQADQDFPVLSWTHTGIGIAGFNVYLGTGADKTKVTETPIPGLTYTDLGFDGDECVYTVTAVDPGGTESLGRTVRLPVLQAELGQGASIKRGLFTALDYLVTNASGSGVQGLRLEATVDTHLQTSDGFDLAAGESRSISVIVPGYSDLPDLSPLTTAIQVAQPGGEVARIVRTGNIDVTDGALIAGVLTQDFTRGATGTVRFTLENTGDLGIELVTARGYGTAPSDEIAFELVDADGNVLATKAFQQVLGEGLITLASGTTVAHIPPGGIFTSAPLEIPVPLSAPDEVFVHLGIAQVHTQFAQPDAVSLSGPSTRQLVRLVDVAYGCSIDSIAPQYSQGDEPIVIAGSAVSTADGSAMPLAPLKLVIRANGFERSYSPYSNTSGDFTFNFQPLAGESGIYDVSCIHPDLLERPTLGQFVIGRVFVSPTNVRLYLPHDTDQVIPLRVTAGAGTTATNLHLVYEAADQPGGTLPTGLAITLGGPVTLQPGEAAAMTVTVRADATADPTGTFIVTLKSDESGNDVLAQVRVDYSVYDPATARPSLVTDPSYIETGVTFGGRVTETMTLKNQGLADAEGVRVTLVKPDGSPAPDWIFLTTPADIGTLAVGETKSIEVVAAPTSSVAEAIHELRLQFSAANHPSFQRGVFVTVTTSDIGNVRFHVSDIYTATEDELGNVIEGLAGATVKVQNQSVPNVEQTLTTGAAGEALFNDLPAGLYSYRASAPNHRDTAGYFWVKPGITVAEDVFLSFNLVSVEWSVTEISIEDRYEITLTSTFETDVPAAVVVIEPASVQLPEMQPGDVYYGEFTLTNYGLIPADNLRLDFPIDAQAYSVEVLTDLPETLGSKERVAVPFRVVALHGVEGAAAAGATGGGECTAALMAIRVTVDYMCSNGQKESGSATLSIFALEGECGSSSSGSSRPFSAALESLLTLFSYSGQGTGGGNFVGASQPSLSSGPQPISNVFCWPVGIGLEALFDPNGSPLLDRIIDLLQKVGCAVNAAVREFNDEALDLRVKMPGGFADVLRRFYDNQWHWEHSRLNVRPGYDLPTIVYGRPASGAMLVRPALSEINKGGVIYYGVGPWSVTSDDTLVADLYVHGTYKIIRHDTGYRWEDKHGNWMNYDANGRLLTSGSRIGTQWQAIYGAEEDGEATGIADRNGRQVLWFEHNGEGLLSAAYDAAGRRVEYQYTDSRLTGVVDAGGRESRYEYDGGGRMVRRIDPEGHVTLVSYDAQGNVIRVEDASGRGTSFDYAYDEIAKESYAQVRSPTGKITEVWYNLDSQTTRVDVNGRTVKVFRDTDNGFSVTDEKGNVTVKELDKFQNLTRIVFPEGTAASFTYEPVYNQVTRVVDPRGFRHDFQYDARGNLVRKIEAVGSPSERTTSYTYDAVGQLITATIEGDARTAAATIRFSYDADGNIASIMDGEGNTIAFPSFDVAGNVLQIRDPLGRIWGSSYDALDRRVSRTDPLGHVTRYEYDRVNNLSALVDAADKRFEYEYNEYNYLTRALDPYGLALSIDYNPDNLPTRILDQEGKETRTDYDNETRLRRLIDGAGNVTSYQYDESPTNVAVSDNPVRIDYPTFSQELSYDRLQQVIEGSDVLDAETTYSRPYAYDAVGNLVSATDEEGNTTRFDYDGLNRLTRIIDAQGNVTERVFDARNNVVAVTDSNGGTTRSEYDRANRLVRTTRPMGQVTTYAYDAAGNLTSVVDAKGQKIVYGYDELHRLVRADYYAAGDHVTPVKTDQFAYDALNQLVSYDDGSTSATYTYDDVGRKTGVTVDYGPFSLSYAYTYYGNGLKASFTGPNGLTYHYIYDANNRLSAVELPDGSQVGYDAYQWNSPTQITLPGGNKLTYGYDPLMRLEAISAEDVSAGTVLDHQIAYSPAGDVSQRITEHGDYLYHYDLLHQLTDAHNAVLTDEAYTYDPLGNRLSAAGVGGLIDHNLNNELVQYGDTSFEYDPNGNLTRSLSPSQDVRFIYDIKDRLVRIERADGTVLAEYYYNPFGRRLWKDVLGVRTHYFYADEGLIGEYDAGGDEVKTYGYVPDSEWTTDPLFQEVGGRHYWYVNDHAGTPQKLVDSAGSTVWSAKYDAFGNAAIDVAVISNNLRLPGQYFDAESGLHYNWHRYYDPRIGRYLTLDPLGTGLNPYVYALNNPLALIDPEGTHAVAAYAGISSLLAGGLPLWAILYVSDNLVADILSLLWGEEVDALGALLLQQLPVVPRWLANLLYGIGGQAALSMGSRGYPTPIFSSAAGPDDLASATKGGTIPGQKNWPEFTKDWKLGKPSRLKEGEVYGKLSKYSPKGEEILYGGDAKHLPHFDYRAKPGGQWYNIDETGQLYFRGYHYKGENLEQGNWVFK